MAVESQFTASSIEVSLQSVRALPLIRRVATGEDMYRRGTAWREGKWCAGIGSVVRLKKCGAKDSHRCRCGHPDHGSREAGPGQLRSEGGMAYAIRKT
jgi:hypothetical protein